MNALVLNAAQPSSRPQFAFQGVLQRQRPPVKRSQIGAAVAFAFLGGQRVKVVKDSAPSADIEAALESSGSAPQVIAPVRPLSDLVLAPEPLATPTIWSRATIISNEHSAGVHMPDSLERGAIGGGRGEVYIAWDAGQAIAVVTSARQYESAKYQLALTLGLHPTWTGVLLLSSELTGMELPSAAELAKAGVRVLFGEGADTAALITEANHILSVAKERSAGDVPHFDEFIKDFRGRIGQTEDIGR